MSDNNAVERITELETKAQETVTSDVTKAAANNATKKKDDRPRQVMKVRHLPREQRRFAVQYADASVPRVQREVRRQPMDYSRAYLKLPIELASDRAQRLFESTYERTDQTLVVSTLVVEAIGQPELVDQTNDQLHKLFDKMEHDLMNCLDALKEGMDKQKIPAALQVAAYDHKRSYEAPIHTPFSSRFISIITLFDRVVARTEAAWVNRLIDPAAKRELISKWDQAVRGFITELGRVRNEAMRQAKETGHRQDALEIEQRVKAAAAQIVDKTDDKADAPAEQSKTTANEEPPKKTASTTRRKSAKAAQEQVESEAEATGAENASA